MQRKLEATISSTSTVSARLVKEYYTRDKRKLIQAIVVVIVSAVIGDGVSFLNPIAGWIVGLVLSACGLFGPVWVTHHREE